MPHVMNWGAMPEEMAELIPSKLPLVYLARLSTTCILFQAVFCKQLAGEQKARCNFAIEWLGRERIISILTLIKRWLEGETFKAHEDEGLLTNWCCIAEDGTYHNEPSQPHLPAIMFCQRYKRYYAAGVKGDGVHGTYVSTIVAGAAYLDVSQQSNNAPITVRKYHDQHLEGVAVVQALLSEGLGRVFDEAGREK